MPLPGITRTKKGYQKYTNGATTKKDTEEEEEEEEEEGQKGGTQRGRNVNELEGVSGWVYEGVQR